jgi:excisionase family DNA binding protein
VESPWLDTAEAAAYLKVKRRTVLQWVREGKLPAHKLSGLQRHVWRFLRRESDAMLVPSSADSAEGRQQ